MNVFIQNVSNSLCSDCERYFAKALNLRWVAWVILLHFRFLFIRLPSSRRCGLAETVGLCFRVDSNRATSVFVLGLVCVCLFCFRCVALFVVGWQQHCRYSVIDAMVYPRSWKSEDKFGTGKTLKSLDWVLVFLHLVTRICICNIVCHEDRHDWSCVSFTFVSERKNFELGAYDIVHESNEMSFGWCSIIYFCFGRATYSSLTTFWSRMRSGPTGLRQDWTSVQCSKCSEMRCHVERGCKSWSPYGWGWLATCHYSSWHSSSWYSFMHGRLVDNIRLVVEEICAVDLQFGHNILLSFEPAIFYDTQSVSDRCWPRMWCIDQFYILYWILNESGTAYCLSWRYLHWLDIEISYRVFDTDQFILSKWWEPTAGNSWRRVWVSWQYLMGRKYHTLSFGTARCIGIVRTMAIFAHLICLRVCVMRCFRIVRTIPTSSSSWSTDQTFDLGLCLLLLQRMSLFFDDFDHRLQGQHCPSAILP